MKNVFILMTLFVSALAMAQTSGKKLDLKPTNSLLKPKSQLDRQQYVETKESIVTINGVEFQQIRYGTETFHIQMNTPDSAANCTLSDQTEKMYAVKAAAKVTKRTKVFVESLRQRCDRRTGSIVTEPNPIDTNIGVEMKDKEGSGSKSFNYKLFYNQGSFKSSY